MAESLVLLGAFCVIAAVVGGGLTLSHVGTMPVVNSVGRQVILALCGAVAIGGGLALRGGDDGDAPQTTTGSSPPAVPFPPNGAAPDAEEPALELSRRDLRPGDALKVSGRGFDPGERVEIVLGGETLGATRADSKGRFADKRVRIPSSYRYAGQDRIAASGDVSLQRPSLPVEISCKQGDKEILGSCVDAEGPAADLPEP